MTVQIITIGDEILIGQIVDTNSAWMGQQLNFIGARVTEIQSVSDTKAEIIEALDRAAGKADVVLVTGGLGPTKDDITKTALAEFFGVDMEFHQASFDRIVSMFEKRGRSMTPAHREQCYMPTNAQILVNKMGSAPGMWFEEKGSVFVSMPGVPYEMKYLMEYEVLPRLQKHFPIEAISHRTILTVGEGESRIAAMLEDFEENLPTDIKLAYLPSLSNVRLRLTGRGEDETVLNEKLDVKAKELSAIVEQFVYGYDTETLESVIGKMLVKAGKTLATAESCTGGYLAHKITAISGSSAYYKGSVIAYSNEVKMAQLGVEAKTLEEYGAVSEPTVRQMVRGAIDLLKTDIAVATSGIAGPTGGTPDKPVGTIWVAVGDKNQIQTRKLQLNKTRLKNIEYTTVVALDMIRKIIKS